MLTEKKKLYCIVPAESQTVTSAPEVRSSSVVSTIPADNQSLMRSVYRRVVSDTDLAGYGISGRISGLTGYRISGRISG